MKTKCYMVRHAQSHPSRKVEFSEWPLSKRGLRQAEELAGLLLPLDIQRIFCSPFLRCRQTIAPYCERTGLRPQIEVDLRERLVAPTLVDGFQEVWEKSWENFSFALPGCENSESAQQRFVRVVERILTENSGETLLFSTHGNVLGLFLNHLDRSLGRESAEALRNPEVLRFEVSNGDVHWDRSFLLPGLDRVATDHTETPMDR